MSGFLGSPPFIYKKMRWSGKAKQIVDSDVISKLSKLEQSGFIWDATKVKLVSPNQHHRIVHQTPWIHQRHGISKRCGFDHHICFNGFGIVPPKCLECWKIVVSPRTFKELITLWEVQQELDVASKCGIEMRDYTNKLYGGYFYTNSFDQGRDRYEQVRKAINEAISPDVPVILKRACTEYEISLGPSPLWHMTPDQERQLLLLEHYVESYSINHTQTEVVKNHVFAKWMMWAHASGDMTYKEFNGNESLFPGFVEYHEGDREQIKQDLAIAKAYALNETKGEDAKKLLESVFKTATERKIDANAVFNMGGNTQNVLNFKPLMTVPEEAKGDLDELS